MLYPTWSYLLAIGKLSHSDVVKELSIRSGWTEQLSNESASFIDIESS